MVNRRYLRQKKSIPSGRTARLRRPAASFLLITAALLIAAHFTLSSTIERSMEYQGRSLASETLSGEALGLLEDMSLSYGDLVTVSRDDDGKIVSIETDSGKLNTIKNTLERNVTQALGTLRLHSYSVPLGTLLGSEWLSGRGPEIPLRLTPTGYLESTVESRFTSAGINQTNHRLVLNLTLSCTTLVPLHRAEITVTTNFVLAETVIVGEVPEYYTQIVSDETTASKARDSAMDPWDLEEK